MIAVWIVLGVVVYLALASLIGRLLRRQQPTNTPPKGGNHS